MISGVSFAPLSLMTAGRRLEDRARLHLVDFRRGDREPAAAMAKHWIGLVERRGAVVQERQVLARCLGDLGHLGIGLGQEFVERRIEQAES